MRDAAGGDPSRVDRSGRRASSSKHAPATSSLVMLAHRSGSAATGCRASNQIRRDLAGCADRLHQEVDLKPVAEIELHVSEFDEHVFVPCGPDADRERVPLRFTREIGGFGGLGVRLKRRIGKRQLVRLAEPRGIREALLLGSIEMPRLIQAQQAEAHRISRPAVARSSTSLRRAWSRGRRDLPGSARPGRAGRRDRR